MNEHEEQKALCQYLNIKKILHYAVPNGTMLGGKNKFAQLNKLRAEGYQNGVPDICIFLKGITLYIEMKKQKGGVVSPAQKSWLEKLNDQDHIKAVVCRGAAEAIAVVKTCDIMADKKFKNCKAT